MHIGLLFRARVLMFDSFLQARKQTTDVLSEVLKKVFEKHAETIAELKRQLEEATRQKGFSEDSSYNVRQPDVEIAYVRDC